MIGKMTSNLDFQAKALVVRAERQRVIASNIANADTPGYAARELDFKAAMGEATGLSSLALAGSGSGTSSTHTRHIPIDSIGGAGQASSSSALGYTVQTQPAMDGNSVDLDRERAAFVDNAIRYESTLRFINGQSRPILSAIQGQ